LPKEKGKSELRVYYGVKTRLAHRTRNLANDIAPSGMINRVGGDQNRGHGEQNILQEICDHNRDHSSEDRVDHFQQQNHSHCQDQISTRNAAYGREELSFNFEEDTHVQNSTGSN